MKPEDKRMIQDAVEVEGFDYAFVFWSHFEEVDDDEFHRLRQAFLEAREKLALYLDLDDEL